MNPLVITLIVVVAIIIVIALWAVAQFNGFVRLRNLVEESWRQIDVELKRRHDLIPNLMETVKGYAQHERSVFDAVAQARAAAMTSGGGVAERSATEGQLTQALGRMFAVAEAYPQLRASEGFQQLQAELTNSEDRIAAGRRFYNANVRTLNTKIESFPHNIIAGMSHVKRAEYFELLDAADREAPEVYF